MRQVREAIGVTMSIVCSNIRLYSSFGNHSTGANAFIDKQLKEEQWRLLLTGRASEMVINIQKTSPSDNLEIPTSAIPQNGSSNGDVQDDVKWMETVLCFLFLE